LELLGVFESLIIEAKDLREVNIFNLIGLSAYFELGFGDTTS